MKLSPPIVGTAVGAAIGALLCMPIVITERTTERSGWGNLFAGLAFAAVGFVLGIVCERPAPPRAE